MSDYGSGDPRLFFIVWTLGPALLFAALSFGFARDYLRVPSIAAGAKLLGCLFVVGLETVLIVQLWSDIYAPLLG